MASLKYKVTRKAIILPIIGLIAFFLYLYVFNVDILAIIATARCMNLSIYALATAFVILDTFFFALSWRALVNFLSIKLSVMKSFLYVWYGIFMDIIIPAESISGEISRVYLVTREQNGTGGKVVASLVVQRLMGTALTVASLLLGISLLLARGQISGLLFNLTLFLAAVTTFFLVLLIVLCVKEAWTLRVVNAILTFLVRIGRGRWKLEKIKEDTLKAARMFHDSLKEFGRSPKTLLLSLAFYLIGWFFSVSVSYLVFLSLNFPVEWSMIVITWSIVTAVKSIPIGVPFEVGLPEITMTTLYVLLGAPPDVSATATILSRIITLWLRFFIGFAAQQWLELKVITATDSKSMSEPQKV